MLNRDLPAWQRNLYVLWIGEFCIGAGQNLVIPFLAIYIQQLGVQSIAAIEIWSGLVFSASFMVSVFAQPVWGRVADRVGRKPMLVRSALGMALVMTAMGFVHAVWQLFVLRAVMGSVSGFISAAIALQASQTPREHAGRALGTLQTGVVTGTLIGPLIGGVLAEAVGIRHVFVLTGAIELVAAMLVIFFVKEHFVREPVVARQSGPNLWQQLKATRLVLPLFVVTMLIQMGYLSIEPIVTVYVKLLNPHTEHLALLSGATFAAIGVGNVISAPRLGRLADRIGSEKVLWGSILAAALLYLPQAFVTSAYQLLGLRLLLGVAVGGLQPSVQALIRRNTDDAYLGRVFGINTSFMMLGNLIGPNLGGMVSSLEGIPTVFFCTSFLLLVDAVWLYKAILAPKKPDGSSAVESAAR